MLCLFGLGNLEWRRRRTVELVIVLGIKGFSFEGRIGGLCLVVRCRSIVEWRWVETWWVLVGGYLGCPIHR